VPEISSAARPYAQALFELAEEQRAVRAWSESLALLSRIVSDPQMAKLIRDPRIERGRIATLVFELCGPVLDDQIRNFVRLLINNERLPLLPQIAALFEASRLESEGVVVVEAISAYPLDEEQSGRIAEAMARRLGKRVELSTSVDPDLIAGAVIKAGDRVIDLSVRGRLRRLASELA
jgi:F-type H+-transporting ATPase subunit delta